MPLTKEGRARPAAPAAPTVPVASAAPAGPALGSVMADAFGLACYIAYSYLFWDSPLLLAPAEGAAGARGVSASGLLLWQGLFTCVSSFVLMLAWGRVAPLRRNAPVLAALAFCESASVLLAFQGEGEASAGLAVLGFSMSGGCSVMRLGWEERMSVRGVERTAAVAALAYVAGTAIYCAGVLMPPAAGLWLTGALPEASLVVLLWRERNRPDEGVVLPDPALEPVGPRASLRACFERVPWRIPVFVALSYACFGATRMSSLSDSIGSGTEAGALSVAAAMLACAAGAAFALLAYRRGVLAGILMAVPIMAAAGIANLAAGEGGNIAVLCVANVGVEITKYIMLFLMIDAIVQDGAPALLCLALLRFAQWGGSALGQAAAGLVAGGTGVLVLILLVLVAALMTALGAMPQFGTAARGEKGGPGGAVSLARGGGAPRAGASAGGRRGRAADGGVGLPGGAAGPGAGVEAGAEAGGNGGRDGGGSRWTPAEGPVGLDLARQVEAARGRYGLSPRETEVLRIWATGRSAKYVEKALFITQSTVKTHLTHIYAKTGTANREELLQLLAGL